MEYGIENLERWRLSLPGDTRSSAWWLSNWCSLIDSSTHDIGLESISVYKMENRCELHGTEEMSPCHASSMNDTILPAEPILGRLSSG